MKNGRGPLQKEKGGGKRKRRRKGRRKKEKEKGKKENGKRGELEKMASSKILTLGLGSL